MPTVPIAERRVQEQALPRGRVATDISADAFGGGKPAEALGSALSGLGKTFEEVVQAEKARADDTMTKELDYKATIARNKMLYGPDGKSGALSRTGKNAMGAADEFGEAYDKELEAIGAEAKNSTQRAFFEKIKLQHKSQLNDTISRHTFGEIKKYEEQVTNASVKTAQEDAVLNYHNPKMIAESIGKQKSLIASFFNDPEAKDPVTQAKITEAVSGTHVSVTKRMLSNGNDLAARNYYDTVKDQISGSEVGELEKVLRLGSIKGESTRNTDTIIKTHGTLQASLDAAKSIKDPEIREATRDRINNEFADRERATRLDKEKTFQATIETLRKTGGRYEDIDPNVRATFTIQEEEAAQRYAARVHAGMPIASNPQTKYGLQQLAANPATRDTFMKMNMWEVRSELDDSDFDQMAKLQISMREGKGEDELTDIRTNQQIINQSLTERGIDPTPEPDEDEDSDAHRVAQFNDLVNKGLREIQIKEGRKTTKDDTKKVVADLMTEVTINRNWWFDKKMPLGLVGKDDVVILDKSDVPPEEQVKITAWLNANKQAVTDDNIVKMYGAKLAKKVKRAPK